MNFINILLIVLTIISLLLYFVASQIISMVSDTSKNTEEENSDISKFNITIKIATGVITGLIYLCMVLYIGITAYTTKRIPYGLDKIFMLAFLIAILTTVLILFTVQLDTINNDVKDSTEIKNDKFIKYSVGLQNIGVIMFMLCLGGFYVARTL